LGSQTPFVRNEIKNIYPIMASKKQITLNIPDDKNEPKSRFNFAMGATLLLGLGGLGAVYYYFSGRAAANAQGGQTQDNVFSQWASAFKNLIDGYTSNDEVLEMIKLANQVTDFAKVSSAYNLLTNGGNLESDISSNLTPGQYQEFITALNKKGLPSNPKNIVTVNPVSTTTKVGDKLLINNASKNVGLYINYDDYGTGKINLLIGKGLNAAPVTVLQIIGKKYADARPPFTINVYKVGVGAAQKPYYISSADILKKVSGIGSVDVNYNLYDQPIEITPGFSGIDHIANKL
jgi:hypothetical protein